MNQPDSVDVLNPYTTAADNTSHQLPFMRTGFGIRVADGTIISGTGDIIKSAS